MKILLVQLASMGDCLFVTSIAKQIKEIDYPNCHLTWLIGDKYKSLLENNPYIDNIITVEISKQTDRFNMDYYLSPIANQFDKVIITDLCKNNYPYFYGTTRSAYFRTYGKQIKDIEPQIYLTLSEIQNVLDFALQHNLTGSFSILLECGPESGQSPLSFEVAQKMANEIVKLNRNIKFIFSSKNKVANPNANIIDASLLSYRENAELTKYCKLLLGTSSGITWLNTSNWAAKIPMVIIVYKNDKYFNGVLSASVEEDFNYWGLSTNKLIEFDALDEDKIIDCILTIAGESFEIAKNKYNSCKILTKEEIEFKCLKYALYGYLNDMFKYYTEPPVQVPSEPVQMPMEAKVQIEISKWSYYRYKFLSKFTFGESREYYKQKYNFYKPLFGNINRS